MSSSIPAVHDGARVLPRADVRLILAAAISGSAAAALADPVLWFSTAGVVALLIHASRRAQKQAIDSIWELQHVPPQLRRVIQTTFAELPEGEAKQLLSDLTSQAANVYAHSESTFDAEWDRHARRNVTELVGAACGVALDVARLDLAFARGADGKGQLTEGLVATRQLFIGRLRDAVSAVAALYAAGVQNGTPASDRVGELVNEIRGDAALTSHARKELDQLLRSR